MPNQIAFYPQSSGGGSGAVTLISSQTLASPAATITFASIPQTFKNLWVKVSAQGSLSGPETFQMNLNGDAGNNYSSTYYYAAPAGNVVNTSASGAALAVIGAIDGNTGGSTIDLHFNGYSGGFSKTWHGTSANAGGNVTNATSFLLQPLAGHWNSTAAITQIVFSLLLGNFAAGSTFSLYGI